MQNQIIGLGKNRLSSVLVAAIVLWSLFLPSSGGAAFANGNQLTGSCGEHATWALQENGQDRFGEATYQLVISGSGAMHDYDIYSAAGYYWASSQITAVLIENGITHIGDNAFADCSRLKSVSLPESVTDIGKEAFYNCSRLPEISIPNHVTQIGRSAFDSCEKLSNITLPDGLTSIEDHTFSFCSSLTEITIPNGVTSIGDSAFSGCSSLQKIIMPDRLTRIGETAFSMCSSLQEVNIPKGVATIEAYTFAWCSGLSEVRIPGSVASVGQSAFESCSGLKDVYYPGSEDQWKQIAINNIKNGNDPLLLAHIHFDEDQDDPKPTDNPFIDVNEEHYFFDAVLWAVEKEITKGTSETTFTPDKGCTRAECVTFLYRYAGSPETDLSKAAVFEDVNEKSYYAAPVAWAVEEGITMGTSETAFSPDLMCSRAQIVTFLWRFSGKPGTVQSNTFEDIEAKMYYAGAVSWAVERKITKGISEAYFSPNTMCTRAQIVTFLYRMDQDRQA